MKKTIGIITTILSYLISCFSIFLLSAYAFEKSTRNNYNYLQSEDDIEMMLVIGVMLLIFGVILLTIGLFLTAAKSSKQKAMEIELSNLKYLRENLKTQP
ncbi:hypothetical protein [Aquaticitalea lipolytica]|uniref:hypothetical protein n=1 Tax=Aquaticitalea lipolytica TaxID=1247562 RepID=UPI0024BBC76D|nr:hypothetical protein [Aquaticitalea lipolytica]